MGFKHNTCNSKYSNTNKILFMIHYCKHMSILLSNKVLWEINGGEGVCQVEDHFLNSFSISILPVDDFVSLYLSSATHHQNAFASACTLEEALWCCGSRSLPWQIELFDKEQLDLKTIFLKMAPGRLELVPVSPQLSDRLHSAVILFYVNHHAKKLLIKRNPPNIHYHHLVREETLIRSQSHRSHWRGGGDDFQITQMTEPPIHLPESHREELPVRSSSLRPDSLLNDYSSSLTQLIQPNSIYWGFIVVLF